jgi:hypothetical protein
LEPYAPNPAYNTGYVMMSAIADWLGLQRDFNPATRIASFRGFNRQNQYVVMELSIGSEFMLVNGEMRSVMASAGRVPVITLNDRVYVPIKVFEDVFGVIVQWNGATQTVTVNP